MRYLVVELLTAALFALAYWHCRIRNPRALGFPALALYGPLLAAVVALAFIDLEHMILPDEITLPLCALGPVLALARPELFWDRTRWFQEILALRAPGWAVLRADALADSLAGAVLGGGLIWLTGRLGKAVFRKEAMGGGDVKLMAAFGATLGWKAAVYVFFLAPIVGSVVGIAMVLRTRNRYVPFGPFLALAAVAALFWGPLASAYLHRAWTGEIATLHHDVPLVPRGWEWGAP